MASEGTPAFQMLKATYESGLLDKVNEIFGQALEEVMEENGLTMEDLYNKMDDARQETLEKIDDFLLNKAPFLMTANPRPVMDLLSRLLDIEGVRKIAAEELKRMLGAKLADGKTHTT